MEETALTFEQQKKELLAKYDASEVIFYSEVVQEATLYTDNEEIFYSVLTKEDGSNGQ